MRTTQTTIADTILPPVFGHEVVDNGVGFTNGNYKSFRTAASRLKLKRGGKGIGRFVWLKAFTNVAISSIYVENGETRKRAFDFVAQEDPIFIDVKSHFQHQLLISSTHQQLKVKNETFDLTVVYVEKPLDFRQTELAKYVSHRRTIIELLNKSLGMKSDGKFSLEDQIHKLLYPLRTTSDELEFGQQNLWLIVLFRRRVPSR